MHIAVALATLAAMTTGVQPVDAAPTDLETAGQSCATATPGPYLRQQIVGRTGSLAEPGDGAEAEFEQWDVAHPDVRDVKRPSIVGSSIYSQVESHTDGVTYAWRVRVKRGDAASAWSDTCHYTIDRTAGEPPVIASSVYLPAERHNVGGIGVTGTFTVTPASDDIVRYRYRFESDGSDGEWTTTDAETLSAPLSFTWAPAVGGSHSILVEAIDRAGNTARASEEFYVRESRPTVHSYAYPDEVVQSPHLEYNVGVPGDFRFDSYVADGVAVEWWIDEGGPSGSTPLAGVGSAHVMIAPTRAGRQTLHARSVTADGTRHATRAYTFIVDNGPALELDPSSVSRNGTLVVGTPAVFHLAPRSPDVAEYLYTFTDLYDRTIATGTIPAATPTLVRNLTVADDDIERLTVRSRGADGTLSTVRSLGLTVDVAAPDVTHKGGNGIGDEYTFTARTLMDRVVDYVVTFNDDPATERVVPAAADGTATFRYTPTRAGEHDLTIYARNAHGRTADGSDSWTVTDAPRISSAEFPEGRTGRLAPGTFTFRSRQPGTVRYEYAIDFGAWLPLTAGADGSATTPAWTPASSGRHTVTARGYTADSKRSATTSYTFETEPADVVVTEVGPSSVPAGGVRALTVFGRSLHAKDVVEVTPTGGRALPGTVTAVSSSGVQMTVEVNLLSAPAGPATVTLRPYGANQPAVVRTAAFTIGAPPAIFPTKAPAVTGTLAVGNVLRATGGLWSPTPAASSYQWSANGVAIKGAMGTSYAVPASLVGKRLAVTVTVSRPGYVSARSVSAMTAPIAKGPAAVATARPKITGTARVGKTLTGSTGSWSTRVDSFRYEWQLNGVRIRGAAGRTLKLTSSMAGKRVSFIVYGVKAGYNDGRTISYTVTVRR